MLPHLNLYLGSGIATDGGSEQDVTATIQKARTAFLLLRPVWGSKEIFLRTKRFSYQCEDRLAVRAETWRVTNIITDKVQAFVNRCLRYIIWFR